MQIFLDTEFTNLQRGAKLISMALYSDKDNFFYAEFNDFKKEECSEWVLQNVVQLLDFNEYETHHEVLGNKVLIKNNAAVITQALESWIRQFAFVEVWADVPTYDWMLFCDLFGGALNIPNNIYYAPFDLSTFFRVKGIIKPTGQFAGDISRFEFASYDTEKQHHALHDAICEKQCYQFIIESKHQSHDKE